MKKIYTSATKMILILFALTLVAGLFTGHISEDQFMYIVIAVFSYYFGNKKPQPPQAPAVIA